MTMMPPTDDEVIREAETDYLRQLAERVRAAAPGVTVTARNIELDAPLVEILTKAASDVAAELIATTTHGRGPFARFWLGGITDELVRQSPVPVMVLRPTAGDVPADLAARPRLEHLLIPLDGSELAERIVAPAIRFGQVFGADYTLVLVLDPDAPADEGDPVERAEAYLSRVARSVGESKGAAWAQVVRDGPPAEAILDLAGASPATGVALATHGRTGLTRLLKGSVADEVIRHATGPVLVYHPAGK
jgi:nucleotide-binding universal stress UspA family protein